MQNLTKRASNSVLDCHLEKSEVDKCRKTKIASAARKQHGSTMAVLPPDPVYVLRVNDMGPVHSLCFHGPERIFSGTAAGSVYLFDLQVSNSRCGLHSKCVVSLFGYSVVDKPIAPPLQSRSGSHPGALPLRRHAGHAGQVLQDQAVEHNEQWLRSGPGAEHKQFQLLSTGGARGS